MLASAALLAGTLTPAAVARAEERGADTLFREGTSTLPESASMIGPALARGSLVSSTGSPIVGATVVLAVEPSNESLAHMRVGDHYRVRFVARATTSRDGRWSMRLPLDVDVSGDISRAGDVNFELMSTGAGWSAVSYFNSAGARLVTGTPKAGDVVVSDRAGRQYALPVSADSLHLTLRASAIHGSKTPTWAGVAVPFACATRLISDLGPRLATVGEGFSDASSVTTSFRYGVGQSSTLGVAVSTSGSTSGYSASGTAGISKTSSGHGVSTFTPFTGAVNRAFRTNFDYRKYLTQCTSSGYYTVKPVSWYGGAGNYAINDVAMGYCVGYEAGSTWALDSTTASTITSGVSLSSAIGINLTSRTGYSSTATLSYFMGSTGHPVCGRNNYPFNGSGLDMVHSTVWTP